MPSLETKRGSEPRPPLTPHPRAADTAGSDLTITFYRHDNPHGVVVDVTGDLDAFTAPRLLNALRSVPQERSLVLVIDLTALTFMGSAGISVLVETAQRSPHIDLRIVAATRVALRPLQVSGVDTVLNVYPSRAEALTR